MGGSSSKQIQNNLDELIAIEKATAYKAGVTNREISNIKNGIQTNRNQTKRDQNRKENPTALNKSLVKQTKNSSVEFTKNNQQKVSKQNITRNKPNQKLTFGNKLKKLKNKSISSIKSYQENLKNKIKSKPKETLTKNTQVLPSKNNIQTSILKKQNGAEYAQAGGRKRVSIKSSKAKKINDKKTKRRMATKHQVKKSTK